MYEKFKKLCDEKGVTPYVVSKHTGIAQATLTEWKQGKYTPKIDKIMKIAQFFNVDVSYFYKE
jgi:transcriptional regulator with XRE-family HTH domain